MKTQAGTFVEAGFVRWRGMDRTGMKQEGLCSAWGKAKGKTLSVITFLREMRPIADQILASFKPCKLFRKVNWSKPVLPVLNDMRLVLKTILTPSFWYF